MLYDEFREGTGCRDNEDNYKIYKDLEILYMNSELTKDEIYEYGKKLVNNGLTKAQEEWNESIIAEINDIKEQQKTIRECIERTVSNIKYWTEYGDTDTVKSLKRDKKLYEAKYREYTALIRVKKEMLYV